MALFEPFQAPYMQRALLAVLLVGMLAGTVGVLVVLRRLAFAGEALTHTVFPGVVVAHLLGASLLLGALVAGLLSAVLLTVLAANRRVTQDAALAVGLTAFFAVGVALVSRSASYTSDLAALLFGDVLSVRPGVLAQMGVVALVAGAALWVLRKELLLRAFDPDAAAALGYRLSLLDLALYALVALVVVAAVTVVGTMLALAFLVIPAVAARLLTERVATMAAVSAGLGALAGWLGLAASYRLSVGYGVDVAASAAVVVALVILFLLALVAGPLRRRLAGAAP